jgi:hypothetical protein
MNALFARGLQTPLAVFAAALFALTANAKDTTEPRVAIPNPTWRALFQGVLYSQFELSQPRPMVAYVIRINTQTPRLSFLATPGLPKPRKPREETAGVKTSSFLREHKLQIAINAAPYGPQHNEEGLPQDVAGLHVSRGDVVSTQTKSYPALAIDRRNRAQIVAPPFSTERVHNAVGGFNIVLSDGELSASGPAGVHPRTAVGINAERSVMWWLVIDGRQAAYSEGASLKDVAEILQQLGASDGINLDGGGTSTMVIEGQDGAPRVVNRPIHSGVVGNERIAASHIGVFARPLSPLKTNPRKTTKR